MKQVKERRDSQKKSPQKNYYQELIEAADIETVVNDLLPDRVTEETDQSIHCDCPNHSSVSGKSLHVDKEKHVWHCFGCGTGGNVLHLAEFVKFGRVTKGVRGNQPASHRESRDYLAALAGMQPLGKSDLSEEEIQEIEKSQSLAGRTFECLTEIADYYHRQLKRNPDVYEWFLENYAISEKTVSALKIGFSSEDSEGSGLVESLKSDGFTVEEILSTGAFVKSGYGLMSFFQERITFPYWSRGRGVSYMIGRTTPWTPENEYETGKYKKLLTHTERHSYVGKWIDNSTLFNEDCLFKKPQLLVITEGITDAISLMERGYAVISPVTVRFKAQDQERLCDKLTGYGGRIIIVNDNEMSQAGLQAALETTSLLCRKGLDARAAELPLGESQEEARKALLDDYGVGEHTSADERTRKIESLSEQEKEKVSTLLSLSKIDVNEYFIAGHTKEEFDQLLEEAQTPLERSISHLNPELTGRDRSKALDSILLEVAMLDPSQQEFYLKMIKDRLGDTSLEALRKHLAKVVNENPEPSENEPTSFEKLYELFNSSGWTAFKDQYDSGWITSKIGKHQENVRIQGSKFVRLMLDLYVSIYRQPVGVETIKLVGELLTARALETRYLHNRYAWLGDRLWIDMGRPDWKVIEVTADGWGIISPEQPIFKRFSHQKPMPLPSEKGNMRQILNYLAVKNEGNQALLLVWLCTCMLEQAPRPGLIIFGIQGSSKTTAAEFLRWLVDPSVTLTNSLAKDLAEFVQLMDHNAVVSLDNLTSLPIWASDALCRSTTGGGYQKRMLYSDDDDITYFFRRVFIVTAISIPVTAPDLLDRSVSIELTRINRKDRKKLSELRESFEKDLPDILGGILDVMVQVIARKDEELEEHPRLADWYGLAYLAADILGVKDAFVKAFDRSDSEQHREVVESHVESELLLEFLNGKQSWDGKKSALYAELTKMSEEQGISKRQWPKTVSAFAKRLKKLSHNLSEMGIQLHDYTNGSDRRISITRSDEVGGEDPSSPLDPKEYGFAVNGVSAVNNNDTDDIPLTATGKPAVSVLSEDGSNSPKNAKESEVAPFPPEVQGWNDSLVELFCTLSISNQDNGKDQEGADRFAIEAVKRSEWFSLWINR